MRPSTVSDFSDRPRVRQAEPKSGTRLRDAYDTLLDGGELYRRDFSHGQPIESILRQLTDCYGLDIRCVRRGVYTLR